MSKIKKILALAISYLPSGGLRVAAYRSLLGYRFGPGCQLGLGVLIAVDHFEAGANVRIRRGTSFMGPITVRLGDKTFIGRFNKIECGDNAGDASQAHMKYAREFVTGRDSLINEGHLFDVLGRIQLGNGSWIAGFASQFLTHGAGTMDRDIVIGDDCFLGSAVRFAPGTSIGNKVVVGMGSVVTKRLVQDNVVVGGVPAKIIKERQEAAADYVFEKGW